MKKFVKPIVASVLAVVFLAAYLSVYEYVIYFHEQHHLFRYTWAYVSETVHQYNIWYMLAEFICQFGYYTWLGAIAWTTLAVGVFLMTSNAIRRLTGYRDLLQLGAIPAVSLFFSTVNVDALPATGVKIFVMTFGVWILSVILSAAVPFFRKRYLKSLASDTSCKWWVIAGGVVLALGYCGVGYHMSTAPETVTLPSGKTRELTRDDRKKQRVTERIMIESERALKAKDWDTLNELTQQVALTGEKNHLMTYFRAIALYHKGKLLSNLLDFPQTFGVYSLYFPWKADRNRAEFGGYIYEQLGAVNAANHWAFEALVGWGETSDHLTNLARYSIALGKTEQARKFIAPLKHSLFYRTRARDLEKMMADGKVPDLKNSLAEATQTPARWDNVLNLGADLRYILMHDPENDMAREYILAHFLLANNLGTFYRNLKDFWPMPEEGFLPPMIEQGLTLVRMHIGPDQLAADGYRISPETDQKFREFMAELHKGNNARFSPEMRRTYWYYVQKVSPYGSELSF